LQDTEIIDALRRQDRDTLFRKSINIFERLNENYNITHFYFHNTELINLLRVHKPDKHGDLIDRFTAIKSKSTKKVSSGIELGILGTFTLRTVIPVFIGAHHIGYLELGKEIEEILANIHNQYGIELVVTIHKKELGRSQWENGMLMLGKVADWDQFPNNVLIYSSFPLFPIEWEDLISISEDLRQEAISKFRFNDKSWYLQSTVLKDVSGKKVGHLFIFLDISKTAKFAAKQLSIAIVIIIALLIMLFFMLYVILQQTDQKISEQQQVVLKSQRQLQHYFAAIENMDMGLLVIDEDCRILDTNSPFRKWFGDSDGQKCHKSLAELDVPFSFCQLKGAIGEDIVMHYHAIVFDDKIFDIIVAPVENSQDKTSVMGIFRNVTEQQQAKTELIKTNKQLEKAISIANEMTLNAERMLSKHKHSEEKLRKKERFQEQLLNDMVTFVAVLNPSGNVIFVNNTPLKVGGLKLKDVIGKNFFDASWWTHSDDVRNTVINDIKQCALGKTLVHDVQIRIADGSLMWIEFSMHPIFDENGVVQYVIPEGRDISDRKESEVALREAKELAEAASKAKDEFLANMSHEIRTPMNAIVGFTEMALRTELTDEQHEYILAVSHGCDTLLRLINDILDFSKIEARKLQIDKIEFNLQDLIMKVVSINQVMADNKKLKFIQTIPSVCRNLIGDPARLQQILTNLIGNAIKFTFKGQVSLIVRIEEKTDDQITLNFSVKDTGIGIIREKQADIFEAFTQADGSITRNFGGTGLGLAISNQLIALQGGTMLKMSSKEGEGSTFSFELPFALGKNINSERCREIQVNDHEKVADVRDILKILLVEDNPVNIKFTTRLLEKQGHHVTVAENGVLGVDAALKHEFDIVLMDIMMPKMDGITATKKIREFESMHKSGSRRVFIVAMTANAMKGDRKKCIDAGMDDYLSKPVRIMAINEIIGKIQSIKQ